MFANTVKPQFLNVFILEQFGSQLSCLWKTCPGCLTKLSLFSTWQPFHADTCTIDQSCFSQAKKTKWFGFWKKLLLRQFSGTSSRTEAPLYWYYCLWSDLCWWERWRGSDTVPLRSLVCMCAGEVGGGHCPPWVSLRQEVTERHLFLGRVILSALQLARTCSLQSWVTLELPLIDISWLIKWLRMNWPQQNNVIKYSP